MSLDPHGGTLVQLLADDPDPLREEARNLPKLVVSERELSDLEMLAVGALSPLTGFQGEADYHSVLETMHLENGLPWSIPVTLSVDEDGAHRLGGADAVALVASEGSEPLAVLQIAEIFKRDRSKEAQSVFQTEDLEHPGVKALHEAGDRCVAGTLEVIALPSHDDFGQYRLRPAETRAAGGLLERDPVADDRDGARSIRADERVQVGRVDLRIGRHQGGFTVARCAARQWPQTGEQPGSHRDRRRRREHPRAQAFAEQRLPPQDGASG